MRKIIFITLFSAGLKAQAGGGPACLNHKVSRNETISGICQRYHCPMSKLVLANPGLKTDRIRTGMKLNIPVSGQRNLPATPYQSQVLQSRYLEIMKLSRQDENVRLLDPRKIKLFSAEETAADLSSVSDY